MGEVHRARDTRLGRDVAVKVLPDAVARDPDRLARFEREARTVAGLNHPNIVVLHSIEEEGGIRFITMELVEGERLDHYIVPNGLPMPRVLELSIPLVDALVAAHEKGVVHRDLKPANVMVTREGRVKVLDFGLAKLARPGTELAGTQVLTMESPISAAGQVVGTVPYMAPEQVRGEVADVRTDLFAIGIIMYELATGRRPFPGKTFADVSRPSCAPEPLTGIRADLRDLGRIVGRCLEDPRGQFQTALDLATSWELKRRWRASRRRLRRPTDRVLPFVNMSRDGENEYFSDGLSEELLSVLAKFPPGVGRTSVRCVQGGSRRICATSGRSYVNTCSRAACKAGNRVRITAQPRAADGFHLWSRRTTAFSTTFLPCKTTSPGPSRRPCT
jgi:serine/threonine protein kinase